MAHLITKSSLHIGLIYGIILGLASGLERLSIRFLEYSRFYTFSHLTSLSGIWLYLLLIGIPKPEYRTIFMLRLLVVGRLLDQVHQSLYSLII